MSLWSLILKKSFSYLSQTSLTPSARLPWIFKMLSFFSYSFRNSRTFYMWHLPTDQIFSICFVCRMGLFPASTNWSVLLSTASFWCQNWGSREWIWCQVSGFLHLSVLSASQSLSQVLSEYTSTKFLSLLVLWRKMLMKPRKYIL